MNDLRDVRTSVGALAVAVTALLLFAPSLANGFAYDDVPIILGDARVQSFEHLGAIFTRGWWASADLALYRPLTTLTFALDWQLAPGSAAWFHFVNVLLHAGASTLVFLLLARLWSAGAALVGALIFAAHPVHVEAVANVVGRAELLSAIFVFGCCLVWSSGRAHGKVGSSVGRSADPADEPDGVESPADPSCGRRSTARAWILPAALFALALLSKESAIVLPAVLVLIDAATGELKLRELAGYVRRNAVAFGAMIAVAVAYMLVRAAVLGAVTPGRLDPLLEVASSPADRLFTALQAWPVWVRLLIFPAELLADWGPRTLMPAAGLTRAAAIGLLLLASTLLGGAIALFTGRGRAALVLLWFPVTMLPVSNLIIPIGVLVAERTLYAPSFAVALAVAALAARSVFAARTAAAVRGTSHAITAAAATPAPSAAVVHGPAPGSARRAALVLLGFVLALFSLRVVTRIPDWRSTDSVMLALVRDRPESFRGHWHLARMERSDGRVDAAIAQYDTAVALWPHRQRLVLEAAGYAIEQKRHAHTLALATLAARRWPDDVESHRLLAGAALDAGEVATAERAIADGLRLAPGDSMFQRMSAAIAAWRRSAGR